MCFLDLLSKCKTVDLGDNVWCPELAKSLNFGTLLLPRGHIYMLDEPAEQFSALQIHKQHSATHF